MTSAFDLASEPIGKRIAAAMARIALALRAKAWKEATAAGVTATQAQAVALLGEAPAGLRLAALAERLGVSAPTASDAVGALVAKELAVKESGPDRRSIALRLTPRGQELAGRVGDWPEFLARAVATLDADQQVGFLRALVAIIRALQESGDIAPQRLCVTCRYFRPYAYPDAALPHHCALVEAPFGDRHLRLNCPEHAEAAADQRASAWARFAAAGVAAPPRD